MAPAAPAAAASPSKSAKQVAPDPAMRASRQPGAAARRVSTRPISGASARAGRSRSLRRVRSSAASAAASLGLSRKRPAAEKGPLPAREDGTGGHRHAGIDQQHRAGGELRRRAQRLADAAHVGGGRAEADRHIGAEAEGGLPQSAGMVCAEPPQPGQAPQHRRRVGRAAAEAGCDGNPLGERDAQIRAPAEPLRQRRRRLRRQIVAGPERLREGTGQRDVEALRRRDLQRIGERGEGDEAVQRMIAVGAAAGHVKVEVELGRRLDADHRRPLIRLVVRLRSGGESVHELAPDLAGELVLGPEREHPQPLEAGLVQPAHLPVGVAQMIVDDRIARLQLDRLFELVDRLLIVTQPVRRPAQAVDDIAVVRPELDRLLDHRLGGVEIAPLLDPRIAEIVENQRLIRLQLERAQKVGLGPRPRAGALEGDAAHVEEPPVAVPDGRDAPDRGVIGACGLLVALADPERVAERGRRIGALGPLLRHGAQRRDRLVHPVEVREARRGAQPRRPAIVRFGRDRAIGGNGRPEQLHPLENLADREAGGIQVVAEEESEARIDQARVTDFPLRQGGGHTEHGLRQPLARVGDEGRRRIGFGLREHALDPGVLRVLRAELLIDFARLVDASGTREQAAECRHRAVRASGHRDGLPQEGLGPRLLPREVVHQAGMEVKEGPVVRALVERRERIQRLLPGPCAGVQPTLGERQHEAVDALPRDRIDATQGALEIAVDGVLQAEHQAGQTRTVVDLDQAPGERGRILDPAVGDQQRYGAAQESGFAGVLLQDTLEVFRRRRIVAPCVGIAPDEVAAERRDILQLGAGRGLRRRGGKRRVGRDRRTGASAPDQRGHQGTAHPAERAPAHAAAEAPARTVSPAMSPAVAPAAPARPPPGGPVPGPTCWHSWARRRPRAPPIRCSAWGP